MTTTAEGRIGHYLAKQDTLLECLVHQAGLHRDQARQLLQFGSVYVERRRVTSDRPLSQGEYIRVHLRPRRFPVEAIAWRETVVENREDFVVIRKPSGIPVHATVDNRVENVVHQLSIALGVPLLVTQRLDADVGGLMVVAKTRQFQGHFNQLLVERKVTKQYVALVDSSPPLGRQVHYMKPTERGPKTVRAESLAGWLECALTVTNVREIAYSSAPPVYEVGIDLETGRTHQIRAQLAVLGCPIVGDRLYGSQAAYEVSGNPLPGIALFSTSIAWPGCAEAQRSFCLPPPWESGINATSRRS